MNIERILYKISGDLVERDEVLDEIRENAKKKENLIDVIYGFGTKLSKILDNENIPHRFEKGTRITTDEGLNIALKISEETKNELKEKFNGYNVTLISPIKRIGGLIVNTNADEIVENSYFKYDKIIVCSIEGRNKEKFRLFKKIEIKYFPVL